MFRRMFVVTKAGDVDVRLDETLRALLHQASEELREVLLVEDDEQTKRLYPTAYPDDEKLEEGYQAIVHDQLLMARLDGIDLLQRTIHETTISAEDADSWMNTVNQIRLVLGTQLDVGENEIDINEDDPLAPNHVVYQVLSHVLEELTHARISML